MEKSMTILYRVGNNIYVNVTNRCSSACVFCLRQTRDRMDAESGSLWLEREPSAEEIKAEFDKYDADSYNEVVFCGFGEPTERIDAVIDVAKYVKEKYNKPIRINTNGQGNLINDKNILPMMEGLIDTVSISLNTPDEDRYNELVRSKFGNQAYRAMLDFAREAVKYIENVVLSTVETTITKEEEQQCMEICKDLGVTYRIRPFED